MSISTRSRRGSVDSNDDNNEADDVIHLTPLPLTPVPSTDAQQTKSDKDIRDAADEYSYLRSGNNSDAGDRADDDDDDDDEESDSKLSELPITEDEQKCFREAQAIFASGDMEEVKKIIASAEFTPNVLLIRNNDKRTLLHHLFVKAAVRDIQIIKILIASGKCTEDVLMAVSGNENDNESTPLHLALRADIPDDLFEEMVSTKACTSDALASRDTDGNTVLHLTVMKRKQSCFRSVLNSPMLSEALLLSQNEEFNTALHCIVALSDFDALNDVLATRACSATVLKVLNTNQETCLYQAANLEKKSPGMSQREFELMRTIMVKRLLKYDECTQKAFAYREPAKDKIKARVIRGTEAVKKLRTLDTTDEIRRDIALYFLQTELNQLETETLNDDPSVREAIKKFVTSMRSVKQEDVSTSELIDMVLYTRRTRAFVSNPRGDYEGYTNEVMRVRKIDRSWAKIAAQAGLVLLFACLTAAAISISLASFGIGGAFVAATFGIVIAKQITIGTGLAIAASVAGLGLTSTSAFFAGKNIRQGELSRAGENIRDKVADAYIKLMGARSA